MFQANACTPTASSVVSPVRAPKARASEPPVVSTDRGASPSSESLLRRLRRFVVAVRDGDESMVQESVLRLSGSRRVLAPLAFMVGGFAMLFTGLKLLFTNWRLTLVQALPAMWIWLAIYDLKAHALHGKSFNVLRGPVLIPIVLAIAAITAACFFLNAVFGFAIAQPDAPKVRPAIARARSHLGVILGAGALVGLLLGLVTMIVTRWGHPWFGILLSIVLGVMMVCYVAVPARLIGVKTTASRRDKLTAGAVGGALGAVVCTPPYLLGRVGILMLGSPVLLIPGIIVVSLATVLQAGATGAVKTVKMSAKLVPPDPHRPHDPAVPEGAPTPCDEPERPREASAPAASPSAQQPGA
jgi:hypothetical protein